MSTPPKKHDISLQDVAYYLDGVERDRLDSVGAGGRVGEVMAIRDKLLRLPDEAFEAAVKSMKALVADTDEAGSKNRRGKPAESKVESRQLYEEARASRSAGSRTTLSKVSGA